LLPKPGDVLKAGIKQPIGWESGNIDSSHRLNLYYSRNGGTTWKTIKKGLRVNGYYLWKPKKKQATSQGLVAICLPQSKNTLAECAVTEGVFTIEK